MNIDCYVQSWVDGRVVGDQLGCLIKRMEKIIFYLCSVWVKNWRWLKGTLPSTFGVFNLNRVQLPFQHYPHEWPTIYLAQELTKSCAFEVFSSVDCRPIHCAIKQLKRNSHSEPNSSAEALCHCSKKGKQLNSVFGCTHWSNQLNAMYRGVSRNPRSASVHKHTWLHNNSSKLSFLHPALLPLFPARNLHAAAAFATSCWLCNRTDTETFPVVVKLDGGQEVIFWRLRFEFFRCLWWVLVEFHLRLCESF